MNTNISQEFINEEPAGRPAAAASEWLSEPRQDIESYVDRETLERLVVFGRVELQPQPGWATARLPIRQSSGLQDSFALAISILATNRAVLDVVRERRPRFSPQDVISEYSEPFVAMELTRSC